MLKWWQPPFGTKSGSRQKEKSEHDPRTGRNNETHISHTYVYNMYCFRYSIYIYSIFFSIYINTFVFNKKRRTQQQQRCWTTARSPCSHGALGHAVATAGQSQTAWIDGQMVWNKAWQRWKLFFFFFESLQFFLSSIIGWSGIFWKLESWDQKQWYQPTRITRIKIQYLPEILYLKYFVTDLS